MGTLQKDKATIGIINYKTLDFTCLCLRTIRKFTRYPYEVIVVDNGSRDPSLEYLQSLPWIRLIERPAQADNLGGAYAHAAALDLALENCNTEFFVSLHSDAFIRRDHWLSELIGHFHGDPRIACVGSGKIESIAPLAPMAQEGHGRSHPSAQAGRKPDPRGIHRYYNRTICCLYRTDVLQRERLSFVMDHDQGLTAGQKLYFELVDRGLSDGRVVSVRDEPLPGSFGSRHAGIERR